MKDAWLLLVIDGDALSETDPEDVDESIDDTVAESVL